MCRWFTMFQCYEYECVEVANALGLVSSLENAVGKMKFTFDKNSKYGYVLKVLQSTKQHMI